MVFLVAPAAQSVEQDGQLWAGLNASVGLGESVRAGLLVQTRQRDDMGELERVLVRPALSLRLNEWLALSVGYDAHLIRDPNELDEHRIWQQALLGTPIRGFDVDHRFRLEQRFGDPVEDPSIRLRYLLGVTSPELGAGLRGVLREELFLNFDRRDPTDRRGLGENRAFAGLKRAFGEHHAVELGYQVQLLRFKGAENALNHTLLVGLSARY